MNHTGTFKHPVLCVWYILHYTFVCVPLTVNLEKKLTVESKCLGVGDKLGMPALEPLAG